jgi:aminopeptidase N
MPTNKTVYRKDYKESNFLFEHVALHFRLDADSTRVRSTISVKPNLNRETHQTLELQGEDLELISLNINGRPHTSYTVHSQSILIEDLPLEGKQSFTLEIETICHPKTNTKLFGLYITNGLLATHCEPEGFRRITYFLDRPDVMATYIVTLEAKKDLYPILLANGNLISESNLEDGYHQAVWEDPYPKPSYLFALVAGKLASKDKDFITKSGRKKLLQIWAQPSEINNTEYALDCLVSAIKWDEERFNLELDLDRYMIVAIDDFNFGGMENKGLNIFHSHLISANPDVATDQKYLAIEGIVAHEYFHNWTGNRVTCRDWFQLSLKEGLTVFRDQQFSLDRIGDQNGRALRRIQTVNALRSGQFPEDSGPMAHPVRPDSYESIDNFYTATVYSKGAEVIRMIHTLLGEERFQKGMALYFERHDGSAVTCDDFVAAMSDANNFDLSQFKLWYSQSGTPHVKVKEAFDEGTKKYVIQLEQSCKPTPGQDEKEAFHIPLLIKLISKSDVPINTKYSKPFLHELKKESETLTFDNLDSKPYLSINREFSAPIILDIERSQEDLVDQLQNDDDALNRWDASQKITADLILKGEMPSEQLMRTYKEILCNENLNPSYRSFIFSVPAEPYLSASLKIVDPIKLATDRYAYVEHFSKAFESEWLEQYHLMKNDGPYNLETKEISRRSLKNLCLNNLVNANPAKYDSLARLQYECANNLTDRMAAISALSMYSAPSASTCLKDFYEKNQNISSIIDTWFSLQAMKKPSIEFSITSEIEKLSKHPAFVATNPNRVSSLYMAFFYGNTLGHRQISGSGYDLWCQKVLELDKINPHVAASLARANLNWKKFTPIHQKFISDKMNEILADKNLSSNVREIIFKSLNN